MAEATIDVLVVDDDPIARELLSLSLQEAGYQVRVARNGLEALSMIRTTPCRVVLTDFQMPGMNGLQLFERLRAGWPQTRIVFMSAGPTDMAEAVLARGAHAWIKKPFRDHVLLETVRAAIQRVRNGPTDSASRGRLRLGLF